MSVPRTLLGTASSVSVRSRVYEMADGLEIDTSESYEISRRRVLFTDVLLVTLHRELGTAYVVAHWIIAGILFGVGTLILWLSGFNGGAVTFFVLGTPSLILLVLRLIFRVDVITIYGRRSKAAMRFSLRKQRAREVFQHVCRRVAEAQHVEPAVTEPAVTEPAQSA